MTERFQQIYDFLQLNFFDVRSGTYPSNKFYDQKGYPVCYNVKQINMWSNLNVKEQELKHMEKCGLVKHYHTKDHGNCYYAIFNEETKKEKMKDRWYSPVV